MDVAHLGLRVDSEGVQQGAMRLDTLTTASRGAEASAQRLAPAFSQGGKRARSYGQQVSGAAGQTANLSAQLNDIGIMLAAGQNPLMLAVQQGSQVNQVFSQMGGGRQALRGIAGAFTSMLSPLNLATFGIIAFGGMAVQWLTQASGSAESAEDALDRLGDTLGRLEDLNERARMSAEDLTEKYGDQAKAAQNLIMQRLELQRIEARRSTRGTLGGVSSELRDVVPSMSDARGILNMAREYDVTRESIRDLIRTAEEFHDATTTDEQVAALKNVRSELENIGMETEDLPSSMVGALDSFYEWQDALMQIEHQTNRAADAVDGVGDAAARSTGYFQDLVSQAYDAANAMDRMRASADMALQRSQIRLDTRGQPVEQAGQIAGAEFDSRMGDMSGFDPILTMEIEKQRDAHVAAAEATARNQEALSEWQEAQREAARSASSGGRSSGGGRSEIDEEARRAQQIMDAARTTAEKYADEIREIRNLQSEGYLTSAQAEKALDKLDAGVVQLDRDTSALKDTFANAFSGIITGADSASEAVSGLLSNFASMAANQAFSSLWGMGMGAFTGATGGGPAISPIGAIAQQTMGGFAGARADGGPVSAGKSYLVGERGPEMFTPRSSGHVTANDKMGGGGGPVSINVNVTGANGNSEVMEMVRQGVRGGLREYDKGLAKRVNEVQRKPRIDG